MSSGFTQFDGVAGTVSAWALLVEPCGWLVMSVICVPVPDKFVFETKG